MGLSLQHPFSIYDYIWMCLKENGYTRDNIPELWQYDRERIDKHHWNLPCKKKGSSQQAFLVNVSLVWLQAPVSLSQISMAKNWYWSLAQPKMYFSLRACQTPSNTNKNGTAAMVKTRTPATHLDLPHPWEWRLIGKHYGY